MRLDTSRGDGTAQGTALPRLCSLTWLAPVRSWPGPEVSIPVLWDGGGGQQKEGMGGLSTGWQGAFQLALCQGGGGGGMAVLLAACRQGTGGLCEGGSRAGPGLKQSSGRGVPAGVPG